MANLAFSAEIDDTLNALDKNGLTFQFPPDQSIHGGQSYGPSSQVAEMKSYTRDFVLGHLIMDCFYETGIFANNRKDNQEQFLVKSELGAQLWITTPDNRLRFFLQFFASYS